VTLTEEILHHLPYEPLEKQKLLIMSLVTATQSTPPRFAYLLKGYAGTGKTSLTGAYVKALTGLGIKHVLLAPTGRAAKVFSDFAGEPASTIHKRIFRCDPMRPEMGFIPVKNKDRDTIFIVDEASMIGDGQSMNSSLLGHLVNHVYSSPGCWLLLIGDVAQLPPVGQSDSPAMDERVLQQYGLNTATFELRQPVRQVRDSGILYNATLIRQLIAGKRTEFKGLRAHPFSDVTIVDPRELEDYLTSSWAKEGEDETVVITRSNWRANMINRDIRGRIIFAEEPLQRSERLIITKNNYFWTKESLSSNTDFLANGEMVTVDWSGTVEDVFGHKFVDVDLRIPGKENLVSAKLILDSLESDGPGLSPESLNTLTTLVIDSLPGTLTQKLAAARKDPYINAIQAKYAYCITCHKAQGGQWRDVYIDLSGISPDAYGEDFYRWLYTAITRCSSHLYLINPSFPVK